MCLANRSCLGFSGDGACEVLRPSPRLAKIGGSLVGHTHSPRNFFSSQRKTQPTDTNNTYERCNFCFRFWCSFFVFCLKSFDPSVDSVCFGPRPGESRMALRLFPWRRGPWSVGRSMGSRKFVEVIHRTSVVLEREREIYYIYIYINRTSPGV